MARRPDATNKLYGRGPGGQLSADIAGSDQSNRERTGEPGRGQHGSGHRHSGQSLTYVLQTGPSNAVIDASGIITWTPVVAQVPSTNVFTTVVTDYNPWAINSTNLSATQ